MRKFILVLLLFALSSCSISLGSEPKSSWDRAQHNELPGIVAIATGWGRGHICTGNLITRRVILTAGHCLGIPAEDLYIVYGCNNIQSKLCKRMKVVETAFHPGWHQEFVSSHDLGVLIAEKPITGIKLAELYEGELIEKNTVMAAGFGRRYGGSGVLYNALVRIIRDYQYEIVAGKTGSSDPNPGDSGGPLFARDGNRLKLTGVLSRSIMSDTSRSGFGIYTKPQSYGWVRNIIDAEEKFFCTPEDMVLSYKYDKHPCVTSLKKE